MSKDNVFKQYARQAKNRLKGGFWNEVKRQREVTGINDNPEQLEEDKNRIKNIIYNKSYDEEEIMYNKIVLMQNTNEIIINPLGRLVDKDKLNSLSGAQRQQYLLNLSQMYNKMLIRYDKEHNNKT